MSAAGVQPGGPVFLSYRQSDGLPTATGLAWLLRAAGVPVWHDQMDLPPGDTTRRLEEALASGLSGAVLLVTPEIATSGVVRYTELPRLLDLEKDAKFVMAVANIVRKPDGRLDYGAPDTLLGQPPGTLARLNQYPADDRAGLVGVVREVLAFRAGLVAVLTAADPGRALHVSVQTRGKPTAQQTDGADVSVRLRPGAHGRLPDAEGLEDLRSALPLLPDAVTRSGATAVRVTGGAHLSVAFAVGAALPATLLGDVRVEGTAADVWSSGTVSGELEGTKHVTEESHGLGPVRPTGQRREVLAYVDLLPERSDAAYTRLLTEHKPFDAWEHLRSAASGRLDSASAGPLVEAVASRLRALTQRHDNARLHLLLRAPFPVAVLLGRLCNTLRVVVYEWDDTESPGDDDTRPRYVPCMEVRATHAQGPVTEVLLPGTATAGGTP